MTKPNPKAQILDRLQSLKLSPEEIRFATLLLEDYAPLDAYIMAGFDDDDPKLLDNCMKLLNDDRIKLYQISVRLDPTNETEHLTRDQWVSRMTAIAVHGDNISSAKVKLEALDKIGKAEGWYKQKETADDKADPLILEWARRVTEDGLPLSAVPVHLQDEVQREVQLALPSQSEQSR